MTKKRPLRKDERKKLEHEYELANAEYERANWILQNEDKRLSSIDAEIARMQKQRQAIIDEAVATERRYSALLTKRDLLYIALEKDAETGKKHKKLANLQKQLRVLQREIQNEQK